MKKHYFFLVFFLGISLFGISQTRYTAAILTDFNANPSSNQSPIRHWKENYSLTYEWNINSHVFSLLDHSAFFATPPSFPLVCTAYHAEFPGIYGAINIEVNDIYITNDQAFFCGTLYDTLANRQRSFYGHFKLQEFFNTSMNIDFYILYDGTPTLAPTILERLVAFPVNTTYKIIAYGHEPNTCNKIIDIFDAIGSTTTINVYDLPANPGTLQKLYIDDMTMNGSYVFFSGHNIMTPGSSTIWFGCYDKMNMGPTLDIYGLPFTEEPNGRVICGAIGYRGVYFSLAYSYYDNANSQWYTRMRVIEGTAPINMFSQQFTKDDKWEPLRMTYLSDLSAIELVHDHGGYSDFVSMKPYASSSYNAVVLGTPQNNFYNIDTITGHHFIAKEQDYFYIQDRTMMVPASTAGCPIDNNIHVSILPQENTVLLYVCIKDDIQAISVMQSARISQGTVKTKCFSFE